MEKNEFEMNENFDQDFSENNLTAKTTETEKKKSKNKKVCSFLIILIIILAISIISIFIVVPAIKKSTAYNNGLSLMNEGKYYDAYITFLTYPEYRDTENLTISCVQKLMDEKNYTDAFKCITQNEYLAKHITVKEDYYADLCAFIDARLISAFSKSRYDAFQDIIACYDIAANAVLPNNYGNVQAYITIGAYAVGMYAEYSNDDEFFRGMSSKLCDLLNSHSNLELVKRILEQDNLIEHFLSGETPEKRLQDAYLGCICFWHKIDDSRTSFYLCYLTDDNIHAFRGGSWDGFLSPEADGSFSFKGSSYCIDEVPQFKITINSYNSITITSCTTNKTMKLSRLNNYKLF